MKRKIVSKKCELCDSIFEVNINSKSKRILNKRFCSSYCARKFNGLNNKNKKRTEEYKIELSKRISGCNNPFFNKKHTEASKKIIGEKNTWNQEDFTIIEFSRVQKDIFDGIMISDGSLEKPSRISSRLTLGFKFKETLERIMSDLRNMRFCPIYKYEYFEKRNGNKIINYFSKSHFSNTLLHEYNRWYKNGVKIIPSDICLSPSFCYWWFVMDGYLSKNSINLCTESFEINDLLFVQAEFEKIDIICSITKRKRLTFDAKETLKFFNYIKEIEIQKEYEYKFKQ